MFTFRSLSITRKVLVIASIIFSFFLIAFYKTILPIVIKFTEKYIKTYDGIIEDHQIFIIELAIWFFIILAIAISFIVLFQLDTILQNLFLDHLKTKKVQKNFFNDSLSAKQNHTKHIFWISIVAGFLIHLKFLLFGEPEIEGFDENFFTALFLISAVLLYISLFKTKNLPINKSNKKTINRLLFALATILLFLFLEEVSYGQHLFKWEASGLFKENNFQSETNLHNFVNPLYRFIYPFVGMGLFLVLIMFWFYLKNPKSYWFKLILPHPSLIALTFFLAASSFIGHNESFEQILSVFLLLYSIRILICLIYPKTITSSQEH